MLQIDAYCDQRSTPCYEKIEQSKSRHSGFELLELLVTVAAQRWIRTSFPDDRSVSQTSRPLDLCSCQMLGIIPEFFILLGRF
jgi:hypothetical protein